MLTAAMQLAGGGGGASWIYCLQSLLQAMHGCVQTQSVCSNSSDNKLYLNFMKAKLRKKKLHENKNFYQITHE